MDPIRICCKIDTGVVGVPGKAEGGGWAGWGSLAKLGCFAWGVACWALGRCGGRGKRSGEELGKNAEGPKLLGSFGLNV